TDLGAQRAGQGEGDERAVDAGHHSPDARAHRQLPTANCESPTNKRLEHQMAISGSNFDDFAGEYPFADRFLDIDGLRYHYVDEGSGEVLLFVHGNPTWSFAWRNFIKELSPHYRCIAVDHVGCGRSDKPQDYAYTLANHVGNLTRLIDELNLERITLVGPDWGGCLGI